MSEAGEVRDTTGEWARAMQRRPIPRAALCVIKSGGTPLLRRIANTAEGQGAPVTTTRS